MTLPRTPSFRLDGRRALVTGASSGIGLGCAMALAEQGAHVVCAARGLDQLKAVAAGIRAAGFSAETLVLDISDVEAIGSILDALDPFDVLVNSVGLARHGPALQTSKDDYDAVMAGNLRAAYFLSTVVANRLISENRSGSMIHISSQMGHVGGIDRAVYCATKHGLEGMVKAMAIEWGSHQIRINTLCPTFVATPLTASTLADPDRKSWIESKIKLGRIAEVEDLMGPVSWLASDAAQMVTGTSIIVDGGWTAD